MTTREAIIQNLESAISTLEQAYRERAQEMRNLLFACKVSSIYEIDDLALFKIGAELDNQMDTLKDLADDLKYQVLKIRKFNEI